MITSSPWFAWSMRWGSLRLRAAHTPPVPPPSRHPLLIVRWAVWCAVGATAIVLGVAGFHWLTFRLSHSITADAFVEAHIVNVAPEMVSGRIVRFRVDENDHVE